ncbi:hypothetical protein ACV6K4_000093 [Acinetobacter baumannii]|nr:hypothetical protein [Acinetobacter baumannii]EKU6362226.1 hypothetical protein [Acinetobacter baumannii]EKV5731292.1 hypothetical protein [Acinetobacter baumannii]EKW7561012.1 hypothetical protein [Acinetobacter baumannii]EKX2283762.1 hypothetical protein [Acinetobacter baumannii]
MDKTQIWIIDLNNKKKLLADCLEAQLPELRSLGKSTFKESYGKFAKAVDDLETKLEMFPEREFWIGWDLCREAYLEQFQKQNRALLPGTLIGAMK